MLRVEVEEQPVVDAEGVDRAGDVRTGRSETQHRVAAVGVLVDQMLDGACRAELPVGRQLQPCQRVSGDVVVVGAQLAPGDRAVLVVVKPDRVVDVA